MSETEMVERVARAMADSDGDIINGEWPGESLKSRWCAKARIAIEVMWEPTQEMKKKCWGVSASSECGSAWIDEDSADELWKAMIDAALGEGDE